MTFVTQSAPLTHPLNIIQLKINYLHVSTHKTILNKTTKTTKRAKKVNENKPKRYKDNYNNSTQV